MKQTDSSTRIGDGWWMCVFRVAMFFILLKLPQINFRKIFSVYSLNGTFKDHYFYTSLIVVIIVNLKNNITTLFL